MILPPPVPHAAAAGTMAEAGLMPGAGTLVLVVGPSGSGKDTLLRMARTGLAGDARFVFPRRVVTRDAVAELEDHRSVDRSAFAAMRAQGAFALCWEAHGLDYGLPADIGDHLAAGRVVVCNGSRRVVPAADERFPRLRVLLVEANSAVRAQRLAARGRETAGEIAARLRREAEHRPDAAATLRIDNSGDLAVGAAAILVALLNIAANEPTAS